MSFATCDNRKAVRRGATDFFGTKKGDKLKRIFKFLKKLINNFWVRLVFLLGVIAAILAIAGAFDSGKQFDEILLALITSTDTISLFLIAAVSLVIANVALRVKRQMEETLKIEDDHHKIVCMYSGHSSRKPSPNANFYTQEGAFMYLENLPKQCRKPRNPESSRSGGYIARQRDIDSYLNGKLFLPSVNVYANVNGNTCIKFEDSTEMTLPPPFIRDNALALMEAHRGSVFSNKETIRLNDVEFDAESNTLTLKTGRSQYFDMLITNRCMDYKLNDLLSLRDVYESGKTVSPLAESKLSNQLGINGLVLTNDGYLLLEKRGFRKAIWKNKFAQPISLAMKKESGVYDCDGKLSSDSAQAVYKKIVFQTLADNFGIGNSPDAPKVIDFDVTRNFLGIARDLLEGGKPNVYVYVTVDKSAKELKAYLEDKARKACMRHVTGDDGDTDVVLPKLNHDKLDSDYYLVPYKDICVNYNYVLSVKARKVLHVKRRFAPLVRKARERLDGAEYRHLCRVNGNLKRECGEALLACIYYANVCGERLSLNCENLKK